MPTVRLPDITVSAPGGSVQKYLPLILILTILLLIAILVTVIFLMKR